MSARLVFSYLAFSTPHQSAGRSTARQDGAAEEWAKKQGFSIAASRQYRDEGVSRFSGRARMKGALSRFLAICNTPAVPAGSVLVVEDFDRLSRENPDDAWELFRLILLAGVEIVVLSLDRWFTAESLQRFEDRLLVQACQHRAHQESAMKARRIRDLWSARRKAAADGKGVATNLPSWVERGQGGALVLIPDRADTLRLMAKMLTDGLGARRVAAEMNAGPSARPCWLRRGEWTGETIGKIMRQPAVWGAWTPQVMDSRKQVVRRAETVRGHYPAVLTEDEASAVRRSLASRRAARGRPAREERSVLRGVVFDAETGRPLRIHATGAWPGIDYLDKVVGGKSQSVAPYKVIETVVLCAVQEWVPGALSAPETHDSRSATSALLSQLGDVADQRDALRAELARPGRAPSTVAILAEQLDAMAVREAELSAALTDLEEASGSVSPAVLRETQSLACRYATMPESERPAAAARLNGRLRQILCGVWIYRNRLTARTGELVVQIWPRAGAMKERRVFVGKPPSDYSPLDVGSADFRAGFPSPLPTRRTAKNATA